MTVSAAPVAVPGDGDSPPERVVLLVESSVQTGRALVEQLCADRLPALHARGGEHARVLARAHAVRAIVLGVLETPHASLELLEEIRRPRPCTSAASRVWEEDLPAIVLAPAATRFDLLRAFDRGADDVIAHPAHYLELRARLIALLRRAERPASRHLRSVGALSIDLDAHRVFFAGAPVELCRLEYELLVHLARNPDSVCSKHELLRAIWGRHSTSGSRTVDSHASRLRRKLQGAGARGLVVNVWGVGYRLL